MKAHLVIIYFVSAPPLSALKYPSVFTSNDPRRHILKQRKKHKCGFCAYSSVQASHVEKHLLTHTVSSTIKMRSGFFKPVKTHRCGFCSYSSNNSGHVKNHLLLHTGEKPHKCNVCGYSCADKSNLQKHFLVHIMKNH
ncbi:hypothetical protein TNCV_2918841 [Trichonephila clavipes]|nr:hypothetical protein TNCV_2918841 [Trichonephila clavipes]